MFFSIPPSSFGLPLYLAEEVLKGQSQKDRRFYERLAFATLTVWMDKYGETREGGQQGLLAAENAKRRRLTAAERKNLPPWSCAGPWTSAAGMLYHLWITGDKTLKQLLKANDDQPELFPRMLAAMMIVSRTPDDYFDIRQAADYLTIHIIAESKASRLNVKRIMANRKNAKRPRGKAKSLDRIELMRELAQWKKTHGDSDRGFASFAAGRHGVDPETIKARIKDD